ncbi:YdaU family protein [Cupriavidus sp. DL-D2]|uniref:YdaU family protein n=1 Tax=Cupriavidus sp. DL-D2 TaxID=3144974 RepID=UPI003214351A
MNFYKRHIGDYIKDAAHLTLLEHGVYARLMDVYYTREAGIPDGQAARLIGARSKDEQQAVQNVLVEFFHLTDGIWLQNRCEREIEEANLQADKNRANGKKGGRPKRIETEQKPTGFSVGSDSDSQKNLSQTPDSRLQTPEEPITTTDVVVVDSVADDPSSPTAKPAKPDCPHQAIVALYHELLPMCPGIRDWTPARAQALRARWNEDPKRQDLGYWRKFFGYVAESDFLTGRSNSVGRKPFHASLDWIVKAENFTKIREGRYHEQVTA